MADQQENFTKISNDILEALTKAKLNGTQYAICLVISRYTFGYQRCEAKLSAGYIANAADLNPRQVKRELQALISRNIILQKEQRNGITSVLGFNKDIGTWKPVTKKTPVDKPVSNPSPVPVANQTQAPVSNPSPKKEKLKENIKEKDIYSLPVQKIFSTWNAQKVIVHQEITPDIDKAIVKAVKRYGIERVLTAIANYGQVYRDDTYYFDYKWSLFKFLTQKNAMPDFMDEGVKWLNYIQEKRAGPGKSSAKDQNAKVLEAVFGGKTGSA